MKQQKRRLGSRNPVKSLHLRTDLQDMYEEEIDNGAAERQVAELRVAELRVARAEAERIKRDKLSKQSHLTVEALAGLASKEDFTSVNLKSAQLASAQLPDTVYLLQIKGSLRFQYVRHRFVELEK